MVLVPTNSPIKQRSQASNCANAVTRTQLAIPFLRFLKSHKIVSENLVVSVIDDDDGMRESMSFLLRKAEIPSQTYSSGHQFLDSWDGASPGCLVVDFQMPEMSGLKLVQEVRSRFGMVPFLLVTGYGTVAMAVEAMKMGAITVIEKPFHHDLFIDTVRNMTALELMRQEQLNRQSQVAERMQLLTVREREIAELVVAGNLTKQIATLLGISTKTVEVHRSRITRKLGVESVAQLVRMLLDAQACHVEP